MTTEQEKQVEGIRARHSHDAAWIMTHPLTTEENVEAHHDRAALLAIVDDLRNQLNAAVLLGEAAASLQPEKLNGGEIMAECFRAYEVKHEYESFAAGWLAAFRMMGAIKE